MHADVVVVGSGAGGMSAAGELQRSGASVILVEAGPALTGGHGTHPCAGQPRELAGRRLAKLIQGLGPYAGEAETGDLRSSVAHHALGGMLLAWTHNCPTPHPELERPSGVSASAWTGLLARAASLLRVSTEATAHGRRQAWLLERMRTLYANLARPVQAMPRAVEVRDGTLRYGGADTLLLGEARELAAHVTLLTEHVAFAIGHRGSRVTHVDVRPRAGGEVKRLRADNIVVAAGAIGTAKLLIASAIDAGPAIGCFLMDHPHIVSSVLLADRNARSHADDAPFAVWIPLCDEHLMQTELVQFPFPLSPLPEDHDPGARVDVITTTGMAPRVDNRLTFHRERPDAFGLPRITAELSLGPRDQEQLQAAVAEHTRVLASVAHIGDGFSATLLASGASGHLMGSHRMGASDDGESVADAHGRVWNYDNLHLAGNGLANGWSVCNPTLTTVALGLRVADSIRAVAAGAPERAAVA